MHGLKDVYLVGGIYGSLFTELGNGEHDGADDTLLLPAENQK